MSGKTLKIDLRRRKLLELLAQGEGTTVAQLSAALEATPVTIRSDLAALERENLLRRVRGGAVPVEPEIGLGACAEEKQAIARAVAARVSEGDRLFINSGTTSLAVAGALRRYRSLAVVTNSLPVARLLGSRFPVVLLGGNVSASDDFTYGADALSQLERYRADWAVLSVDSISAAEGVTICHPEESAVSCRMLERAVRGVIAADHTKIGRTGFVRICDAGAPLMLVTCAPADDGEIAALRAAGVDVLQA